MRATATSRTSFAVSGFSNVLHLEDGRYALIECKLGRREIEEGASHLLELKRLIGEHNEKEKQMPIREPDFYY